MSSLVDSIFGGTDDSAQKNQIRANERTQQFIEEQSALARGDVNRLMPMAANSARSGYEQAFNLMRQVAPRQIDAIRFGNIEAQKSLLAGLPQAQAAILGNPTTNQGMKPVDLLGPEAAAPFRNAKMRARPQPFGQQQAAQPAEQPVDYEFVIQQLLGGMR